MRCDGKDIPEAVSGVKPDGWWLIGECIFGGTAAPGGESGTLGAPGDAVVRGTAVLAVGEGRVIGIVSPNDVAEPALWWAWPLAEISVETVGTQGLIKKRPAGIKVHRGGGVEGDGDSLAFKDVSRLFRSGGGRYQTGQEQSLLAALGK
jgi:hypothetical protein